jgi:tetratricopeptide (TPR) repeat protein
MDSGRRAEFVAREVKALTDSFRLKKLEHESQSPLGRGKGRQALGWVVASKRGTHPGAARPREVFSRLHLRATPPEEWIFTGEMLLQNSTVTLNAPARQLSTPDLLWQQGLNLVNEGNRFLERSDWTQALAKLDEAMTLAPQIPSLQSSRAQCLARMGRRREAVQAALATLMEKTGDPEALGMLCEQLVLTAEEIQSRPQPTLQLLDQILQASQQPVGGVQQARALCLQVLGKTGEAIGALEQEMKSNPANIEAQTLLEKLRKSQQPAREGSPSVAAPAVAAVLKPMADFLNQAKGPSSERRSLDDIRLRVAARKQEAQARNGLAATLIDTALPTETNAKISAGAVKEPVEQITWNGQHVATIMRKDYLPESTTFVTPDNYYQQAGMVVYPKGGIIQRHLHLPIQRHLVGTSEALLVKKGRVEADLHAIDKSFLGTWILEQGDLILLAGGGHGFRCLEDTVLLEIKQGPYTGLVEKEHF